MDRNSLDNKNTPSHNRKQNKDEATGPGLERRDFIKLGATGVVASLAGCATPVTLSPATAGAEPSTISATPELSPTPEIGDLVDPERIRPETWQEPWTWRPADWPDRRLQLNVIRNQNPGFSPSPASFGGVLFSYGGISPGPTIRTRGDGNWKLTLRNTLGLNKGFIEIGPMVNSFDLPPKLEKEVCALVSSQLGLGNPEDPESCLPTFLFPEQVREATGAEMRPNWHIGGHVNGFHATHTTNLHTHGLHVQPQSNPDGTHSDNVYLRIIPKADYHKRKEALGENADVLADHEHVAELDYDIRLAYDHGGHAMPHPPGTHWYHPHSHGSTQMQVASGMAGFLIVEGDVDSAINLAMTGEENPDPAEKTGPYDYRERLMFLQRVFLISQDLDAGVKRSNLRFPPFPAVNGIAKPTVLKLRPGAVERWRVINGSVDGAGTKRFMVLDGQFTVKQGRIWRVKVETSGAGSEATKTRTLEPVTEQDIEDAKLDLQQLSMDGITLVTVENGQAVHRIKDLSKQNAGTRNPFARAARPGEPASEVGLKAIEDVFRDGDSLQRAFVRPNEMLMANANRADLFFKAPLDAAGKVYTIFAKESQLHSDTHYGNYQIMAAQAETPVRRPQFDVALAYIHVTGKPVEGGDFDVQSLNVHLPPVPPLLLPVHEDELKVPAAEAKQTGVPPGSLRTRTLSYSGTGGTDLPILELPAGFAEKHPELENRLWGENEGVKMVLPNLTSTMGVNSNFDLKANPTPHLPRKFSADDPTRPKMLVNTAEEWVVYNVSMTMWAHTDLERFPQPGSYDGFHFVSYPITRAEGRRRNAKDSEFRVSVKGNDHPFHIHTNPMWVLRIDVPDENGELHNVLPEPCWMDTAAIPRNGGRIVFRSRFDDFTGTWIHHCHVLAHEDNGMMQMVECVDRPSETNYRHRSRAATHEMASKQVDAIYPRPSLELMYRQTLSFIDPSPIGGYEYPGFKLEIPKLEDF
jgi:FtsP/CotA-like multicopper oxidase with cupredoxin domain